MNRQTILSPCGHYRYVLWREWDKLNPGYAMFVGLNPSTADEMEDDPTIRRCADYAKRWGYGALCMANLFAFRATLPKDMMRVADPIGPENDRWLIDLANNAGVVVAAWGVHGQHRQRDKAVIRLVAVRLTCLWLTKDGYPCHPLYLPKSLTPIPYDACPEA